MDFVYGVPYAYINEFYDNDHLLREIDWYDSTGLIVARAVYADDAYGSYDLTLQGKLFVQKVGLSEYSYKLYVYQSETVLGYNSAYYVETYDAPDFLEARDWYDSNGQRIYGVTNDDFGNLVPDFYKSSGIAWGQAYTSYSINYDQIDTAQTVETSISWYGADGNIVAKQDLFFVQRITVYTLGRAWDRDYKAIEYYPYQGSIYQIVYTLADNRYMTENLNDDGSYDVLIPTEHPSQAGDPSAYDIAINAQGVRTSVTWYSGYLNKTQIDSFHSDGGHDTQYFASGTAWGIDYRSYDESYSAAGAREKESFFDGYGQIEIVNTFHSDGSHDVEIFKPGVSSPLGAAYASRDYQFAASGQVTEVLFYDAAHKLVDSRPL